MARRPAFTCRRKGCNRPRARKATFCGLCWSAIPKWLRAAMDRARTAGDAARLTALTVQASTLAADAAEQRSATAFASIARITGDGDQGEAA